MAKRNAVTGTSNPADRIMDAGGNPKVKVKLSKEDKKQAKLLKKQQDKLAKQEKKQKHKIRRLLLRLALVLLLLALVGAFGYFSVTMDIFGTRTWFITQVVRLDPAYDRLAKLSSDLDLREKELNIREENIENEEERLNKRATELDTRELSVVDQETQTTQRSYIFREPMSEQDVADMNTLGRIYAAMDSEKAAAILLRLYNVEETAAILYYMPVKNSAAILAAMDPDRAARITEILLAE